MTDIQELSSLRFQQISSLSSNRRAFKNKLHNVFTCCLHRLVKRSRSKVQSMLLNWQQNLPPKPSVRITETTTTCHMFSRK